MEIDRTQLEGLYLVADPCLEREILLDRVRRALEGGIDLLQLWNRWPEGTDRAGRERLAGLLVELAGAHDVPVLINNEWELLKTTSLAGVHFDAMPDDFDRVRREIGRDFLAGITCENDLEVVRRADEAGMDYISFCAMFPSPSAAECEIVHPDTVRRAREFTDLPLFVSGGITPERLERLEEVDFNGVAVISGILEAQQPGEKAGEYREILSRREAPS